MKQRADGDRTVTSSLIFNESSIAVAGDYLCFVLPPSTPPSPAPPGYIPSSGVVSFHGQERQRFVN